NPAFGRSRQATRFQGSQPYEVVTASAEIASASPQATVTPILSTDDVAMSPTSEMRHARNDDGSENPTIMCGTRSSTVRSAAAHTARLSYAGWSGSVTPRGSGFRSNHSAGRSSPVVGTTYGRLVINRCGFHTPLPIASAAGSTS